MERDIFIGDVHGCRDELLRLLEQLNYDSGRDRLAFVGDLVDRGPDSVGVVRWVREMAAQHSVVCVRGNHEHQYVRFRARLEKEGYGSLASLLTASKRALFEAFSNEDLDWMAALPFYERVGDYLLVHGGVDRRHATVADLDRRKYQDRIMLLRTVDPSSGQMTASGVPWAERYDGRFGPVVYGHEPRDEVRVDAFAVGLDTSCCFGGSLTAMVVRAGESPRFVAVSAARPYATRRDAL